MDVEHSDGLFLLDPAGNERVAVLGTPDANCRQRCAACSTRRAAKTSRTRSLRGTQPRWSTTSTR
jgi:hypothetical protein